MIIEEMLRGELRLVRRLLLCSLGIDAQRGGELLVDLSLELGRSWGDLAC